MTDTPLFATRKFTCGQVLCLIDAVDLYGPYDSPAFRYELGSFMTGLPVPVLTSSSVPEFQHKRWMKAICPAARRSLKMQLVRQYPEAFRHALLERTLNRKDLSFKDLLHEYMEECHYLDIDLSFVVELQPLSLLLQRRVQDKYHDPAFIKECSNIMFGAS